MLRNGLLRYFLIGTTITLNTFLIFNPSLYANPKPATNKLDEIKHLIPDSLTVNNRVVYVDFWASWCAPCQKSFPWMNKIATDYDDSGLVIITINVDKDKKAAQRFLKHHELKSISLFDPEGKIAKSFGLKVMPTSFVYDKTGAFVFRHEGFLNKESNDIEDRLLELLRGNHAEKK